MAEADTTTLPTPIPTSLNVTALAKRFGLARTITLAERAGWETDPAKAAKLREAALTLWAKAHQARRDAMYLRGRR